MPVLPSIRARIHSSVRADTGFVVCVIIMVMAVWVLAGVRKNYGVNYECTHEKLTFFVETSTIN